MGIYTSTFEDVFNESRPRITFLETLLTVSVNILSPFVGYVVDKLSARNLVAMGYASIGLGFILISRAGELLHIYIVFVLLLPLGVLAIGAMPSSALITRWFRKRRGLALGISVAGSSIGGAVAPPLMTFLFMSFGWRSAMLYTGCAILLTVPVVMRFMVNYPEDVGLEQEPDHDEPKLQLSDADKVEWTIPQIFKTRAIWLQTLVSGSLLCVTLGLLANLSLHAKDLGFTGQKMALLYSTIAFFSFSGKIAFGTLTDKIGLKLTGYLSIVLMSCGLFILYSFQQYYGLVAGCVVLGLAIGGVTPIWTTMIATAFGAKSFGRAMGVMNPMHIPITAPSAPVAAYLSVKAGSYQPVFLVYICLMVVAAIALYFLQNPQHPASTTARRKM